MPVPDVGLRLICSECGGKEIETRGDMRAFNAVIEQPKREHDAKQS
jgi:hypothetical protein